MKSTDISSLNSFYETDTGKIIGSGIASCITNSLRHRHSKVLALGFCADFFELIQTSHLYYAIPRTYPLVHWPRIRPFKTMAVDEAALPFAPNSWDCILAVHFMEFTSFPSGFLREAFRTLRAGGKLVVVAVNGGGMSLWGKTILPQPQNQLGDILRAIGSESFRVTDTICWDVPRHRRCACGRLANNVYGEIWLELFSFVFGFVVLTAEKDQLSPESVGHLDVKYEAV
ncbi:MAG: class I SAM-dependent methyltransferase [Holosporaceae bacterium]|jgi:SAM-dependent methyltransferase|nr:class I SAM-dependent methyltransferase [Holosporaceae bacterium]